MLTVFCFFFYILLFRRFPPSMWAWLPDELPSTTNGAESFHADFNRQFASAHPNIHASIQVLLEIQAQTYVKMQSVEVGEKNKRRASVRRKIGRKVQAWEEVRAGLRSRMSYLKAIGYMTKSRQKKRSLVL